MLHRVAVVLASLGFLGAVEAAIAQFDQPLPAARAERELPDFDLRRDDPAQRALARAVRERAGDLAIRQAAVADLQRRVPGAEVNFDRITGAPRYIRSPRALLSPPLAPPDQPQLAVQRFIEQRQALVGVSAEDMPAWELIRSARTEHNGITTLWWRQMIDGVPVFGCEVRANVTAEGSVATFGSTMLPERAARIVEPARLSAAEALERALANIDVAVEQLPESAEEQLGRLVRFAPMDGLGPITEARFVYFPLSAEEIRPVWVVIAGAQGDANLYEVFVDAADGRVLRRQNMTSYFAPATYRVFADASTTKPEDNPAPLSPGPATPDGSQGASATRDLITLEALDATASPAGWLPAGATTTVGNNVDAHLDRDNNGAPDLPRTTFDSVARTLDFPFSDLDLPLTNADAAVTQMFYTSNWYHDRLYQLGFTEPFANFQTNNFGRGGTGGDVVLAQVQDGADLSPPNANNANWTTGSLDGSFARTQMFVWDGPSPDRDGAFDTQIVIHELTHGLSIRLHAGLFGDQPDGMGEGWSDFYAIALLADPADDPDGTYGVGQWATFQGVGTSFDDNYYFSIRRYPYTTDMTRSPVTYADIDPTSFAVDPLIPRNPVFGSLFPAQVHNVGTVWCAILWECRRNLIDKHGFAGNEIMLQLVTDGMKLSAANPNFIEARDGILLADVVNNGGANLPELWAGFAKRGLGVGAASPLGESAGAITESFAAPTGLEFTYPNGLPDRVEPNTPLEIVVDIAAQELASPLIADSPTLFFESALRAPTAVAMTDLGGGRYSAVIPRELCGSELQWSVAAETSDGVFSDPPGAPASFHVSTVATFQQTRFGDNFELDQGWIVNPDGTDTATTGVWVREAPVGTTFQPAFDNPAGSGTVCFITGNANAGDPVGVNDIDNGATTLMSPRFDCTGGPCVIAYSRWMGANNLDSLVAQLSNDDGANWTTIEDQRYLFAWRRNTVLAEDLLAPSDQMRLRFVASDTGTPSIVEAAVDDVTVSVLRCQPADITRNGSVGPDDLLALLASFGADCPPGATPCPDDIDGDLTVGPGDLLQLLASFGQN